MSEYTKEEHEAQEILIKFLQKENRQVWSALRSIKEFADSHGNTPLANIRSFITRQGLDI